METWPAKDPDAVLDYGYEIPLDDGDAVASYTFEKLSGDVDIDSHGRVDEMVTVWLSGGSHGETSVFRIAWITTIGREDDDTITISVADHAEPVADSGYADPTAADLKAAFPAFDAVADSTVEFWLERARRSVDQSWTEGDYAFGQMLLAAHKMTLGGLGSGTDAELNSQGLGDFKSVRSGSFSFTRADSADSTASGSLGSTSYGRQWASLAKANVGGARTTATGSLPEYSLYPDTAFIASGN